VPYPDKRKARAMDPIPGIGGYLNTATATEKGLDMIRRVIFGLAWPLCVVRGDRSLRRGNGGRTLWLRRDVLVQAPSPEHLPLGVPVGPYPENL
jgi:hypothetical protein